MTRRDARPHIGDRDMTEAPERIWAADGETPYYYVPNEVYPSAAVAYVRADRLSALEAENARLKALLNNPKYLDRKARYLAGQLSFHGEIAEWEGRAALATQEDREDG